MNNLEAKANSLSIEMIKDILVELANDFREEVELIEQVMLDELESRLPSVEFVSFVEAL